MFKPANGQFSTWEDFQEAKKAIEPKEKSA
jgi:hypothetical protein